MNELSEEVDKEERPLSKGVKPLVTFGLLTDIQYADVDNGTSYDKKRIRYYRNSLNLTREAVKNWLVHEQQNNVKFKFLIQLGDIIDLKATENGNSMNALNDVLNELNKLFVKNDCDNNEKNTITNLLHIWGNHEMYNFKRSELVDLPLNTAKALGQNLNSDANYYVYNVTEKLRLICLDFYKFSLLGYDETDEIYKKAFALITKHNKNENLNSYENMRGHALRFCKFNGSNFISFSLFLFI
jgi:manganese-dependent ADP-ribose/CDP-alcohol diphosphatase